MAITIADGLDVLRRYWDTPGAGHSPYTDNRMRPIALTDQNQRTPFDNPLWEIASWLPATSLWGDRYRPEGYHSTIALLGLGDEFTRHGLCEQYSWSIPTPGDITWMTGLLQGRGVVEIGAGTGYWAWQLQQAGVDVTAYDPYPVGPGNEYCKGGPYAPVLPRDATVVADHPDRALLMVWPPYGGTHAHQALSLYEGDLVIYAGEGRGGCTADDDFYRLLATEWEEVSQSEAHVTWGGIHCCLTAYRR